MHYILQGLSYLQLSYASGYLRIVDVRMLKYLSSPLRRHRYPSLATGEEWICCNTQRLLAQRCTPRNSTFRTDARGHPHLWDVARIEAVRSRVGLA